MYTGLVALVKDMATLIAEREVDDAELDALDAQRHADAEDGFANVEDFIKWADETRERSLVEQLVTLTQDEQDAILDELDPEGFLYSWESWARPSQIIEDGDWTTCVVMAGRGWGKTRSGAEWVRRKARENPGCLILLLARTLSDIRNVMVGGESGILAVCPIDERPEYIPTRRALVWPNGSTALAVTSYEPSMLRGPQAHFAWADEIGAYNHVPDESGLTAWQNLRIATRLGNHPQVITTTTPRRLPAIEELLDEVATAGSGTVVIRGRTIDNVTALSRSYLATLFNLYHGTALWRQEILGELVDQAEGALWSDVKINKARALTALPALPYRVVAVDPSVAENPRDECGIMVVGGTGHSKLHKRHAYVLEDATVLGPPAVWAQQVVDTARKWKAAGVVAEGNQGSELVRMAINAIDPNLRVFLVNARQNKQLRAEPVVTAYEGGRVHHVGYLGTLEAQMTGWEPGKTKKSPDRVDALVYGVSAVLLKPPKGLFSLGRVRARSAASKSIPGVNRAAYTGHGRAA